MAAMLEEPVTSKSGSISPNMAAMLERPVTSQSGATSKPFYATYSLDSQGNFSRHSAILLV